MKTITFLVAMIVFAVITNFSQTMPPIEPGVSQTLAKWRAANYSDVRYKLNITLEKGAPLMKGDIEIRVTLTDEGAKFIEDTLPEVVGQASETMKPLTREEQKTVFRLLGKLFGE